MSLTPVPKPERTASQRGRANKRKGYRKERTVADKLGGERVPLSGSLGGNLSNDVQDSLGMGLEVKSRKDGFKQLYRWLCIVPNTGVDCYQHTPAVEAGRKQAPDYLVVCADNSPELAVMPLATLIALQTRAVNAERAARESDLGRAIQILQKARDSA